MSTARTTTPPTDAPRQPSPEVAALDLLRRDEEIAVGALVSSAWREDADAVRLLRDTLGDGDAILTPDLQRYWRATCSAIDAGEGASTRALLDHLHNPTSEDADRITECAESTAAAFTDGLASAKAVRLASIKRGLQPMVERFNDLCLNGSTADELAEAIDTIAAEAKRSLVARDSLGVESFASLAERNPSLYEPVIDGLIRRGETANIIAASKVGKSWLAYNVALSIVTGRSLWDAFPCSPGRVLLVDNELHAPTIAHRIPKVADALGIPADDYRERLDVLSLRGLGVSMMDLRRYVDRIEAGHYTAVIADAWYRFIPAGMRENDNADVMTLYNALDRYAASTDAAWIVIHHASKGSQADKSVTDVGAGAGAQSRAADTHLILREHEEPGHVVLDAAVRSFAPVAPLVLQWRFPLWEPAYLANPDALKGRKTKGERRQEERDADGIEDLRKALADGPLTVSKARGALGSGESRAKRLISIMVRAGEVEPKPTTISGNPTEEYHLVQ